MRQYIPREQAQHARPQANIDELSKEHIVAGLDASEAYMAAGREFRLMTMLGEPDRSEPGGLLIYREFMGNPPGHEILILTVRQGALVRLSAPVRVYNGRFSLWPKDRKRVDTAPGGRFEVQFATAWFDVTAELILDIACDVSAQRCIRPANERTAIAKPQNDGLWTIPADTDLPVFDKPRDSRPDRIAHAEDKRNKRGR